MQAARLAERSARTQLATTNMAIKVSLLDKIHHVYPRALPKTTARSM